MIEQNNTCKVYKCDIDCYNGSDCCALHTKEEVADWFSFIRALDQHIENNGHKFNNMFFPAFPANFKFNPGKEKTTFYNCVFHGVADFSKVTYENQVVFSFCIFNGMSSFIKAVFLKEISFHYCVFNGPLFFDKVTLNTSSYFRESSFIHGIDLRNTSFTTSFEFYKCKMGKSIFLDSDLSSAKFRLCDWGKNYVLAEEQYQQTFRFKNDRMFATSESYINKILFIFSKLIGRGGWASDFLIKLIYRKEYARQNVEEQGGIYYIEHTGWNDFEMAELTYRKLRIKYNSQGEADIAGEFFYKEKAAQRMQKKWYKRILHYWINERLFGYGEKIGRVIFNSVLLILIYSCSYYKVGIYNDASGEIVKEIGQSIYFSIVTFTTLGYGDFNPTGWIKFVAASEALFGAILIALFVVTLTRKLLR
ncbi:MAG: hypothetical protein GWP19_06930 [Planctomycetia bacterium]|nr:hypothetical protein [Planctomycetia bacterium]